MKVHRIASFALIALLLGGCAALQARAEREQARLAAVHAAAGKPVDTLPFVARVVWSWDALNKHELLIYTRPRQAWLLNVGVCPRLPYATGIGLTSHAGKVGTYRDSVVVPGGSMPCTILEIRPVDVDRLEVRMQQRQGATVVPSPAASSP